MALSSPLTGVYGSFVVRMNKPPSRIGKLVGLCLTFLPGRCFLRWFERHQVYHPRTELAATGHALGRPFEEVAFLAGDGPELAGWFFPAQTTSTRARLAVLVCHGNGGNIGHRLELCDALLCTGLNVLIFDYRGYGRSQGRPSEEGTYKDAQAALHWLQARGFPSDRVVAFGESLGGGVVSELALRTRLAGIVLLSTFTSVPDLGVELFPWLPVKALATIHYDTRAKLPRLALPVLVMHSRTDELIGFHHAQQNFDAAPGPKLFWELTGGHNDPLADRRQFVEGWERFLGMLEACRARLAPKE
jgi:uncharacterized protein